MFVYLYLYLYLYVYLLCMWAFEIPLLVYPKLQNWGLSDWATGWCPSFRMLPSNKFLLRRQKPSTYNYNMMHVYICIYMYIMVCQWSISIAYKLHIYIYMCVCVCSCVFYVPLQSSSPFCECPRSSQIELHSWAPKYCQHHPKFSMNAISYLDRSTWILETLPFAHLRKHFTFAKTERKSKGNRLQNVDRHRQ
jgi:hypothetical protein